MALRHLVNAAGEPSIPIRPIRKQAWNGWLEGQVPAVKRWLEATRFDAEPGKSRLVPGPEGDVREALLGLGADPSPWDWAGLPFDLPAGRYHLESAAPEDADAAALGWALGSYRFDRRGAPKDTELASLVWPDTCRRERVAATAEATFLIRDLINAPASELGPAELADAAAKLAKSRGADIRTVVGPALLEEGFPAIHAVGRAAATERAPRLADLRWGDPRHPKVTLVGKGVCFDSGGLDLKSANNMKLMKKDMGGAAHVLGLGSMIMALGLPVRLRVLVPAVENSVSGSAMRPLDVVPTRKGTTIEIGNTDAEGRVILADALTEASSEAPALLVDFATLTGAARVALGAELPALFSNDDATAEALLAKARAEADPLWRMPLFEGYRKLIDSKVADITNSPDSPLGGAITAALFLREFVDAKTPWVHIDLMAWNPSSRPGRPEGGEAMGLRAIFAHIEERFR